VHTALIIAGCIPMNTGLQLHWKRWNAKATLSRSNCSIVANPASGEWPVIGDWMVVLSQPTATVIIQSICSINTTCRRYMTCLETTYCRLYTGVAGIVIGAWMRRPNGQRWLSFVRRTFTSPIPVKSPRQYPPQMTLCRLFITIVKQRHCDWNQLICSMPCFGCALNP